MFSNDRKTRFYAVTFAGDAVGGVKIAIVIRPPRMCGIHLHHALVERRHTGAAIAVHLTQTFNKGRSESDRNRNEAVKDNIIADRHGCNYQNKTCKQYERRPEP